MGLLLTGVLGFAARRRTAAVRQAGFPAWPSVGERPREHPLPCRGAAT